MIDISEADWKWAQEALDAQALGQTAPTRKRKMNEIVTDTVAQPEIVEATEVKHFIVEIDEEGKETLVPVSVAGVVQDEDFAAEPTVH